MFEIKFALPQQNAFLVLCSIDLDYLTFQSDVISRKSAGVKFLSLSKWVSYESPKIHEIEGQQGLEKKGLELLRNFALNPDGQLKITMPYLFV